VEQSSPMSEPVHAERPEPELIGYADKLSVEPGASISFMVSSSAQSYEASVVRLIHGDENPEGPGFKFEPVPSFATASYAGRVQTAVTGSYVRVPAAQALSVRSFTLQAWIFPTTPQAGVRQGLMSRWSEENASGYRMVIEPEGDLALWIGDGETRTSRIRTGTPMHGSYWYFAAASYNADTGRATLHQAPLSPWLCAATTSAIGDLVDLRGGAVNDEPFLLAAAALAVAGNGDRPRPIGAYNGKIDSPRLFSRALTDGELDMLRADSSPDEVAGDAVVASWDLGNGPASTRARDASENRLHGETVNMPGRAVTSHLWNGQQLDHTRAPREYAAIHFHADDLEDACWSADLDLATPDLIRSGVYALRVTGGGMHDHIPFIVRPARGKPTAKAVVLMPTMTYLAYANERLPDWIEAEGLPPEIRTDPADDLLRAHPEWGRSTYDIHDDGSGVFYSSFRRPIVNIRPDYRWWMTGSLERLPADLYVIDWLEHEGFAYDVITDHDLHAEGQEILEPYRVLITGTHPEYWTAPMLAGLEGYMANGGRLMYLGGNGFYWVTGVHPERPHVIEVRRANGTRTWGTAPGETYLNSTGEPGGLWRFRGKPANALVGSGFAAQDNSASQAAGYRRTAGSFDPRAAFIFDGVGADEIIGEFGLLNGGAAGYEVDRLDYLLGTPPHALLLASSTGRHGEGYLMVVEDILSTEPGLEGPSNPKVRADMVYMEGPQGGAVFSVGSINWCGSLSHNEYSNNVSIVTGNVLRAFLRDQGPDRRGQP
jgi:N,N-dimethylformamidase